MGCCALTCKKCGAPQAMYEELRTDGKGYKIVDSYSCREHRYVKRGGGLDACKDCGTFGYGNCRHIWSRF